MKNSMEIRAARLFPEAAKWRGLFATFLLLVLVSCASQGARDAEIAAAEAEQAAMQQEAAQLAAQRQREQTAQLQRQRDSEAAERARVQQQRDRQEAEASARAQAERQQRDAAEQRENRRLAAIAAAESARQAKLVRVAALEQQIASLQSSVSNNASRTANLAMAIDVAEELLAALAEEQAKYEDTDADGNTAEPLQKERIVELESRKNELMRQANAQ